MRCEDYLEFLSPYLDHELAPEEVAMLEAHLKECKKCSEELEVLKLIMTNVRQLEEKEVPQGFHEQLMEKVYIDKKHKPFYKYKFFPYLSSAAALFIFMFIFTKQTDRIKPFRSNDPQLRVMQEGGDDKGLTPHALNRSVQGESLVDGIEANQGNVRSENMPMPEEWSIESKELLETVKQIEEWSKISENNIQVTFYGEEATILFDESLDRQKLKLFLEDMDQIGHLEIEQETGEGLILKIKQSNP